MLQAFLQKSKFLKDDFLLVGAVVVVRVVVVVVVVALVGNRKHFNKFS